MTTSHRPTTPPRLLRLRLSRLNRTTKRTEPSDGETVAVPEWGGSVRVRALTGREWVEYHAILPAHRSSWIAVRCLVDESGLPLFTDSDLDEVGCKSALPLSRVRGVALDASGLSPKAQKSATSEFRTRPEVAMPFRLALALGLPVEDLLSHVSALELSRWVAFEKAHGPVGHEWRDRAFAAIHEQIRLSNHLFGQATWGDDNPVTDVVRLPLPDEMHEDEVEDSDEDDDDEFD